MKYIAFFVSLFFFPATLATAQEVKCAHDPTLSLVHTTVGVERMFSDDEKEVNKQGVVVIGVKGTAWFLNPQTLVTIGHVATGIKASGQWKDITIFWSDKEDQPRKYTFTTQVQLGDIVLGGMVGVEPLMTLVLKDPVPRAVLAHIRYAPLKDKEPVVGIGYKDDTLRFATGQFMVPKANTQQSDSSGPPPGYLDFELADWPKDDRMVFDYGASGAPIFDCKGLVVAVVQNLRTQTMNLGGIEIRYSTAWGDPNVVAAPASVLGEKK